MRCSGSGRAGYPASGLGGSDLAGNTRGPCAARQPIPHQKAAQIRPYSSRHGVDPAFLTGTRNEGIAARQRVINPSYGARGEDRFF